MLVAGVIDIHRMKQQEMRRVPRHEIFRIGKKMIVRIIVAPVKRAVDDAAVRILDVAETRLEGAWLYSSKNQWYAAAAVTSPARRAREKTLGNCERRTTALLVTPCSTGTRPVISVS